MPPMVTCWNTLCWQALRQFWKASGTEMFPIMLQQYICEVALLGPGTARSLPSCPTGMNPFQQETADRDDNKNWMKGKNWSPVIHWSRHYWVCWFWVNFLHIGISVKLTKVLLMQHCLSYTEVEYGILPFYNILKQNALFANKLSVLITCPNCT